VANNDVYRTGGGPVVFGRRKDPAPRAEGQPSVSAGNGFKRQAALAAAPDAAAQRPDGAAAAPPPLVESETTVASLAQDLTEFFGPKAEMYLAAYRAAYEPGLGAPRYGLWRWFLWVAFFFPVPWLLHRKLYLHALAVLVGTVTLGFVIPKLALSLGGNIALSLGLLLFGKRLYVDHALRALRKADERGLSGTERTAYLTRSGGRSTLGLVIGIAIMAAPAIVAFVDGFEKGYETAMAALKGLPACDDRAATDLAAEMLASAPQSASATPGAWTFADFSDVTTPAATERRDCRARAAAGRVALDISYTLTWMNKENRRFLIRLTAHPVTPQ
jgi:Protein of unknown function (DUF2628)